MGVKRPGHEVGHSPPSSVEVKNECCYTPPVTLYAFMEWADTNVTCFNFHITTDFYPEKAQEAHKLVRTRPRVALVYLNLY